MHSVQRNGAVASLAHLDGVGAVLRHHGAGVAVLNKELGIVRTREDEAFGIEDFNVRIIKPAAQSHAFDFGGESLTFFGVDRVNLLRFIGNRAGHGAVERQFLMRLTSCRTGTGHHGEGPHIKGLQLGDTALGAHAHRVFAERTIRGHLDRGLHAVGGGRLQLHDLEAFLIKENLLSVIQAAAIEGEHHLLAHLHTSRGNAAQSGINRQRGGESRRQAQTNQGPFHVHSKLVHSLSNCRYSKPGQLPRGNCPGAVINWIATGRAG